MNRLGRRGAAWVGAMLAAVLTVPGGMARAEAPAAEAPAASAPPAAENAPEDPAAETPPPAAGQDAGDSASGELVPGDAGLVAGVTLALGGGVLAARTWRDGEASGDPRGSGRSMGVGIGEGEADWTALDAGAAPAAAVAAVAAAAEYRAVAGNARLGPVMYDTIGVAAAHALRLTGQGQVVAVLDEGFDTDHRELRGKVIDVLGQTIYRSPHGTHVAATVAGRRDGRGTVGVAPGARLHLSSYYATDWSFTPEHFASVTDAAQRAGAVAQSNSWGWDGDTPVGRYLDGTPLDGMAMAHRVVGAMREQRPGLGNAWTARALLGYVEALDRFQQTGVVVFASANDETMPTSDTSSTLWRLFPRLAEAWITVANVHVAHADPQRPRAGLTAVRQSAPCGAAARACLLADGGSLSNGLRSAVPGNGYDATFGTSMAAPQVSGAVAILGQAFPGLTPRQITARLLATANNDFSRFRRVGVVRYDDNGRGQLVEGIIDQPWKTAGVVDFGNGVTHAYSRLYGHGFLDLAAALQPVGAVAVLGGGGQGGTSVAKARRFAVETSRIDLGRAFGDGLAHALAGRQVAVFDALGAPFPVAAPAFVAALPAPVELGARVAAFGRPGGAEALVPVGGGLSMALSPAAADGDGGQSGLGGGRLRLALGQGDDHVDVAFGAAAGGLFGLAADTGLGDTPLDGATLAAGDVFALPWLRLAGDDGMALAASHRAASGTTWRAGAVWGRPEDAAARRLEARGTAAAPSGLDSFAVVTEAGRPLGGGLSLLASGGAVVEHGSFLGSETSGAFGLDTGTPTLFAGLGARLDLGGGLSLAAAWHSGWSTPAPVADSLFADLGVARSDAFALALAGRDALTPGDGWSVSLSQPLRVAAAPATFALPVGRTTDGALLTRRAAVDLAPTGRQLDLGLAYHRPLGEGARLSLGVGFSHAPGHRADADLAATTLLRLSATF